MVLLHVLLELSKKWELQLHIAHFNHRLRGNAADGDEQFVRRAAERLRLPIMMGRGDVQAFARKNGESIEMAARELRHRFFVRCARGRHIGTVALAHHADDQVELFFLRVIRGAGADGFAGMNWSNPSPSHHSIQIIRPLLGMSKAQLLAYAAEHKVAHREDASNASSDFLRNRIRHELLPVLGKIHPQYTKGILRTMEIVGDEGAVVGQWAKNWEKSKSPPPFEKLGIALQRRILQFQLMEQGISFDFELIENLRENSGRPIMVAPAQCLTRDSVGRIRSSMVTRRSFRKATLSARLRDSGGTVHFAGRELGWKFVGPGKIAFGARHEYFDADKIGEWIILRHWQPGDRFQPIGMEQSQKLQDCFTDLKVPAELRRKRVVATTLGGEIFWVEGLRISERFKLDNGTRRRLKWSFR